jgi:hypothetical protein
MKKIKMIIVEMRIMYLKDLGNLIVLIVFCISEMDSSSNFIFLVVIFSSFEYELSKLFSYKFITVSSLFLIFKEINQFNYYKR